ncbi:DUF2189 domain-containing protein [Microvirga sp. 2TAF3]|uniref:DUF2189 domain-containing protein n=1 Tax=Microvirga sp. 2TAF3 TaxID=3233014 RepID=UPI003F96D05F
MANFHVIAGAEATPAHPVVRKIGLADIKDALVKGLDDFLAMPSHLAFLGLIYPIFGICLAALSFSNNALPLLYPLVTGFALVGPFAAIGLYEISRRRELGLDTSWHHAFDVLRSPSIPSIVALGILLLIIFLAWLAVARSLYEALFGPIAPTSYSSFFHQVLTSSEGWTLIILGNAIGFIFAAVVLSISVISFPLLLDRDVGAAVALQTSIRAALTNPFMIALWGLIVATALVIGSIPLLVGLAIVMPVLGHATWHLYRKLVEPSSAAVAA